jgi:hypothetical protein
MALLDMRKKEAEGHLIEETNAGWESRKSNNAVFVEEERKMKAGKNKRGEHGGH